MSLPLVLPQAHDAEIGVLSAMLIAGADLIEQAASELTIEHFATPGHGIIFRELCELRRSGKTCDFITLTARLRDVQELDACGGVVHVTEIFTKLPTAGLYAQHAAILREKFILRRILSHAAEFSRRAHAEQDAVSALLEEFQAGAVEIGSMSADAEALRHITKDEVLARLDVIEQRYRQRGKLGGLPTGFTDLDRTIDGLKGKHVYVFAGRPGMGKSAFGTNIAEHLAVSEALEGRGVPVAFFTLEMPREQVLDRILFARAELSLKRIRDGFMSESDFPRLQNAATELIRSNLILDDTPGLTIAQFRARARRAVLKHKARLIVIDYVQIMKGSSRRAGDNRSLELAEIMQGIRETAKQLDVPIIVLAQINRTAEERSNSRPALADLKESGAIEEEANVVGLLYRPAYYAKTDEQQKKVAEKYKIAIDPDDERETWKAELDAIAELDLAKHRNGGVGTIRLRFLGELTRFQNLTGKLYSNNTAQRQQPDVSE